jgi:hypothetical protein
MSYSKSIAIVLTTFVCATAVAVDAGAQSRGRSGGRAPSGGHGGSVGRAAPRGGGSRVIIPGRSSRVIVGAPLRSYYYPYYYGFRPGLSIGLGFGYPYYYGYYGYPYYGAYGYSYGGYYPAGYPGYGYGGYGGYVVPGGAAYGGIRIQGAPRNAEVYVDGAYAGIVDDYDGVFQRLDLEPGSHEIEIRTQGRPLTYDVNVTPGQTVTLHANAR